MKIKISEATPLQLNWLVAKCEGKSLEASYFAWFRMVSGGGGWSSVRIDQHLASIGKDHPFMRDRNGNAVPIPAYSTNWAQGGPIIEREEIALLNNYKECDELRWRAFHNKTKDVSHRWEHGATPLVAALRCYVASKLGDEVEIPEELL